MIDNRYGRVRSKISIHALREEGDPDGDCCKRNIEISIHALREEGDDCGNALSGLFRISIHALREEGDGGAQAHREGPRDFYPRPPRGGRPRRCTTATARRRRFLSTPSARRATDFVTLTAIEISFLSTPSARRATQGPGALHGVLRISIHALREEGDCVTGNPVMLRNNFYPRPPRGGRRATPTATMPSTKFLSTPSARRATEAVGLALVSHAISIHALREEGDLTIPWYLRGEMDFYPRPPRGGRPFLVDLEALLLQISIHALREEGDSTTAAWHSPITNFYPRPPRGGRRPL